MWVMACFRWLATGVGNAPSSARFIERTTRTVGTGCRMMAVGDYVHEVLFIFVVISGPTALGAFAVVENSATFATTSALVVFGHPYAANDFLQRVTRLVYNQDFYVAAAEAIPHFLQSFDQFVERHRVSPGGSRGRAHVSSIAFLLLCGWNLPSTTYLWHAGGPRQMDGRDVAWDDGTPGACDRLTNTISEISTLWRFWDACAFDAGCFSWLVPRG